MKMLHRPDLYCWSAFDEARNLDFHSYFYRGPEGSVVIDPLPMSGHDRAHLADLGGADWIVVTNSDHVRDALGLAGALSVPVAGPSGEQDDFPIPCARWLDEGDELVPGLKVLALAGSKTPGELALLIDDDTLVTGDLVRSHQGGRLTLLPDGKLSDRAAARASVERLVELGADAVLVGDGWPVFRDGQQRLREALQIGA